MTWVCSSRSTINDGNALTITVDDETFQLPPEMEGLGYAAFLATTGGAGTFLIGMKA